MEGDEGKAMSFGDVVRGQEKHDVARTFSALLQLVIPAFKKFRHFSHGYILQERKNHKTITSCCGLRHVLGKWFLVITLVLTFEPI